MSIYNITAVIQVKRGHTPEGTHPFMTGWHVYILQCHDGTLYTGISNDVARRLKEHNAGTASKYTRGRRPVKLLASRGCADKSNALKIEYKIKSLSRKEKLKTILNRSIDGQLK